jgi:ABC-type dipeptide/oligopeptide/nickel transport system permease component
VLRYTASRVLQLIPVLLLLSMFVFAIVHALPGDAIDALVPSDATSNPVTRAALEKELGLDRPIYVQYFRWLERIVLHGDFGKSITTRRTISVEVFKRLPATIYLAVTAVCVSLLIAIPLGTIAAVHRRTLLDYVATATAMTGVSIPEFWFAILCVLFFALFLGWLPASEDYSPFDNFWLSLKHLVLPAAALGVRLAAVTTRLTRSAMLDEIRKEYVDTARALGLPEHRVIYRYTLRNALIPTVTVAGLQFARLLGGTVVIETIFSWPGFG